MFYIGELGLISLKNYFGVIRKKKKYKELQKKHKKYSKVVIELKDNSKMSEQRFDLILLYSSYSKKVFAKAEKGLLFSKVSETSLNTYKECYSDEYITVYISETEKVTNEWFYKTRGLVYSLTLLALISYCATTIDLSPLSNGSVVNNALDIVNRSLYSDEIKENIKNDLGLEEDFDNFNSDTIKAYLYYRLLEPIEDNDKYNRAVLLNQEQHERIEKALDSEDTLVVVEEEDKLYLKLDEFGSWRYDIKTKSKHFSEITLDLRGNTGGKAVGANQLLSNFMELDEVETLILKTFKPDSAMAFVTFNSILYDRTPLSYDKLNILINDRSASASELVADLLKAHDPEKVTLIGEESYGKIEVIHAIMDGEAFFTYTTGLIKRQSGEKTRKLIPDIKTDDFSKYILKKEE